MKPLIIIIILLSITGCGQKLTINSEIINMNYYNYQIQTEDYSEIINTIEESTFYCDKKKNNYNNFLTISTTNSIITFSILGENKLEYHQNNKYCYSEEGEKLISLLNSITQKYTSDQFYTAQFIENYEENNEDLNIRLDKSSEYVVISLNEYISDFRINEVEIKDNNFEEINLIYSQQSISQNTIVIRKEITSFPTFKITFTNKYGYTFNIIPIYNDITKQVEFNSEIK